MPKSPSFSCSNHSGGHTPHFIQARKATEGTWQMSEVEYLGSDAFQLTLDDGKVLILHNHEPARLLDYLETYRGWPYSYSERYYLLGVRSAEKATAMFSMSRVPLEICTKF